MTSNTDLVVHNGEVLDQPTLIDLRETIIREDACIQAIFGKAVSDALPHAIRAGDALLAAQALVPYGKWQSWYEANVPLSQGSINNYMLMAQYQSDLPEGLPSVGAALRFLRERGATRWIGNQTISEDVRAEALRLVGEGVSQREAARRVGVSHVAVQFWVDPGARGRHREYERKRRARAKAAREALRRQERERAIKDAVRNADAALAEAYARAESFDNVIAQAHRAATDSEAREALSLATSHYHKMRDEIVRALGIAA